MAAVDHPTLELSVCEPTVETFVDEQSCHLPMQADTDVSHQNNIKGVQIPAEMTLGFQIKLFQQSYVWIPNVNIFP